MTEKGSFWEGLDKLVEESEIIIDRPKNTAHPRYPDTIHPLDYGYLSGTSSMDDGGIDVWCGSLAEAKVCAVMCILDLVKRDSEIKILIGCTDEEITAVEKFHNGNSGNMRGLLIRRKAGQE